MFTMNVYNDVYSDVYSDVFMQVDQPRFNSFSHHKQRNEIYETLCSYSFLIFPLQLLIVSEICRERIAELKK